MVAAMPRLSFRLAAAPCAAAALALALGPAPAHAQLRIQVIPFETLTLTPQQFLLGDSQGKPVTIAGELRLPHRGGDKLPAVVLVHGLAGAFMNVDEWARALNGWGVAAFILDSLSGRGIAAGSAEDLRLGGLVRTVDAYRALALLAQHPRIDPDRIAVMGFSLGAAPAVLSSVERFRKLHGPPTAQFAAHIGLYAANCGVRYRDDEKVAARPIRLFHGSADDWTPIEPCRALAARLKKAGADVSLTEFPGAAHAYDRPDLKERVTLPQAVTLRNCSLAEGEGGRIVNTRTGSVFGPGDPCLEPGASIQYDEAATAGTRQGVKALLVSAFGLKP